MHWRKQTSLLSRIDDFTEAEAAPLVELMLLHCTDAVELSAACVALKLMRWRRCGPCSNGYAAWSLSSLWRAEASLDGSKKNKGYWRMQTSLQSRRIAIAEAAAAASLIALMLLHCTDAVEFPAACVALRRSWRRCRPCSNGYAASSLS